MATIPFNQQFHTVSHDVDTIERGSAQANSRRQAYSMQDIMDTIPSSDVLAHKFPIKSGETMSKGDLVMLQNNGEIFNIESSGSDPYILPIGSPNTWWTGGGGPSGYKQMQGNIEWVSDNGDFLQISLGNAYPPTVYGQGGNVSSTGVFTYLNSTTQLSTVGMSNPSLSIDESTFGQPTVKGIISSKAHNNNDFYAYSFEYDVATQVFTMSASYETLISWYDPATAMNSVNVSADKYVIASAFANQVVVLTVTNNVPTIHTRVQTSDATNCNLVKISSDVVVFNYRNISYNVESQVLNISGNTITLGDKVTSNFMNGNIIRTSQLNLSNKYYLIAPGYAITTPQYIGVTYDATNNTVIYDTTAYVPDTSSMMGWNPWGVGYYDTKGIVVTTGDDSSGHGFMIQFDTLNNVFTQLPIAAGANVAGYVGMALLPNGDFMLQYGDSTNWPNVGLNEYGQLGNVVSNLSGTQLIGVNKDSTGTVKIENSIITDASLSLTINSPVYVAFDGSVSSTSGATSFEIGYAISATSYVLKIR